MPKSLVERLLEETEDFFLQTQHYQSIIPLENPLTEKERLYYEENYQFFSNELRKCSLEEKMLEHAKNLIRYKNQLEEKEKEYQNTYDFKKCVQTNYEKLKQSLRKKERDLKSQTAEFNKEFKENKTPERVKHLNALLKRNKETLLEITDLELQIQAFTLPKEERGEHQTSLEELEISCEEIKKHCEVIRKKIEATKHIIKNLEQCIQGEKAVVLKAPLVKIARYNIHISKILTENDLNKTFFAFGVQRQQYETFRLRLIFILVKDAYARNDADALYGFAKELTKTHSPYTDSEYINIISLAMEKTHHKDVVKNLLEQYKKITCIFNFSYFFIMAITDAPFKNFIRILLEKAELYKSNEEDRALFEELVCTASTIVNVVLAIFLEAEIKKSWEHIEEKVKELQLIVNNNAAASNSDENFVEIEKSNKSVSCDVVERFCQFTLTFSDAYGKETPEFMEEYYSLLRDFFGDNYQELIPGFTKQDNVNKEFAKNIMRVLRVLNQSLEKYKHSIPHQRLMVLLSLSHGMLSEVNRNVYIAKALMEESLKRYTFPKDDIYRNYIKKYSILALRALFLRYNAKDADYDYYDKNIGERLAELHAILPSLRECRGNLSKSSEAILSTLDLAMCVRTSYLSSLSSNAYELNFMLMEISALAAKVSETVVQCLLKETPITINDKESYEKKIERLDKSFGQCEEIENKLTTLRKVFSPTGLRSYVPNDAMKTLEGFKSRSDPFWDAKISAAKHWQNYYSSFTYIFFEKSLEKLQAHIQLISKELANTYKLHQPKENFGRRKNSRNPRPAKIAKDFRSEKKITQNEEIFEIKLPTSASSPPKESCSHQNQEPLVLNNLHYFISAISIPQNGVVFPNPMTTVTGEKFSLVKIDARMGFYVKNQDSESYQQALKNGQLKNPHSMILIPQEKDFSVCVPFVVSGKNIFYDEITQVSFEDKKPILQVFMDDPIILDSDILFSESKSIISKKLPVDLFSVKMENLFLNFNDWFALSQKYHAVTQKQKVFACARKLMREDFKVGMHPLEKLHYETRMWNFSQNFIEEHKHLLTSYKKIVEREYLTESIFSYIIERFSLRHLKEGLSYKSDVDKILLACYQYNYSLYQKLLSFITRVYPEKVLDPKMVIFIKALQQEYPFIKFSLSGSCVSDSFCGEAQKRHLCDIDLVVKADPQILRHYFTRDNNLEYLVHANWRINVFVEKLLISTGLKGMKVDFALSSKKDFQHTELTYSVEEGLEMYTPRALVCAVNRWLETVEENPAYLFCWNSISFFRAIHRIVSHDFRYHGNLANGLRPFTYLMSTYSLNYNHIPWRHILSKLNDYSEEGITFWKELLRSGILEMLLFNGHINLNLYFSFDYLGKAKDLSPAFVMMAFWICAMRKLNPRLNHSMPAFWFLPGAAQDISFRNSAQVAVEKVSREARWRWANENRPLSYFFKYPIKASLGESAGETSEYSHKGKAIVRKSP